MQPSEAYLGRLCFKPLPSVRDGSGHKGAASGRRLRQTDTGDCHTDGSQQAGLYHFGEEEKNEDANGKDVQKENREMFRIGG